MQQQHLTDRAREYALLMRIDKPIGTLLLLWPTMWALWIAGAGKPDIVPVIVFVAGAFLMRSAGCVVNDLLDRKLDIHVSRTKDRPLAARRVTPREAILLFVVLASIAFLLVLLTNRLTLLLSIGGALLAITYPLMKRFTYLPQVYLGAAFGWAIPMAFAAQTGAVPEIAWLLFFANVLWVTAYDTEYAMVDRKDDLKIGIKSTAILFGELDRAIIGVLQITFLTALFLLGERLDLGGYYQLSLAAALILFLYQQWLIRRREESKCFRAFLNNNWVGMVLFGGIAADYLIH